MAISKKKIKEIKEIIEVVVLAIPREIESHKFYLRAARRSSGEESQKLFHDLAQEEKEHEKKLKNLLSDLKEQLVDSKK